MKRIFGRLFGWGRRDIDGDALERGDDHSEPLQFSKFDGHSFEFSEFLGASLEDLRIKTEYSQEKWHFGEEEGWEFDQDSGQLTFTFPEFIVKAPAQIIGSFNARDSTWLWAWANSSIDARLTEASLRVRDYGEQHGIWPLTTPKWSAEEMDGWRLAALACSLCNQRGAYRAPADSTLVFMTFAETVISRRV
jgi:hypothetical protein